MNDKIKQQLTKPFNVAILIFIVCVVIAYIFTQHNAQYYKTPIGQITDITHQSSQTTIDQNKNKDTLHKEQIHLEIQNGQHKGDRITVPHKYTDSF